MDLYAGDAAAAWRRVEERWPELRRSLLLRIEGIRVEAHWVRARAALRLYEEQGDPALLRAAERDADVIARAAFTWGAPAADLVRAAVARARGEHTTAATLAARGAAGLDAVGVSLYAASARKDVEWMKARGVRDPAALMRLYAPGL